MSERYDIRDKVKVWDNTRSQQGVTEGFGITYLSHFSKIGMDLGLEVEGRITNEEKRRVNEADDWKTHDARREETWQNNFGRENYASAPFVNDTYSDNLPLRETIFEQVAYSDEDQVDVQTEP